MVPCLLEEVEEVFTRHKLEKQQQKVRSVEHAVQRDNVGVGRQGLMNVCLRKTGV